jgi:MFS family permease
LQDQTHHHLTTPPKIPSTITLWLQKRNQFWFSVIVGGSAFLLYSCVYAFRKAFAVATFDEIYYLGISYKVWLVTFQVAGYALSKFIGIKIISELQTHSRTKGILLMVAIAGLSWLAFALTPAPYNIIFLFTNGLPLGLIWGMIFNYLEGRRSTEALGAGLSVSFIFASGFSKTVGALLMKVWGVSELWMPFATSCVFIIPLLFFLWILNQVPPPNAMDEAMRTKRKPMNKIERERFVHQFFPGIVLFVLTYMLLTAFRDFRDNFSAELWQSLGYGNSPEIFTLTEIPVSLTVLSVMASLMLIKKNITALMVNHIIVFTGMLLIGTTTYLFEIHAISPPTWMILIGLGLYMGYVPFNSTFFDRLIATFRFTGTVGFIMYVADSFGYLASVGVLFYKEFGNANITWVRFFIKGGYITAIIGGFLIAGSMLYFFLKNKNTQSATNPLTTAYA